MDKLWEAGKLGRCPDLGLTAKLMFDQTKPKIKPHLLQLGEAVGEPSTYLMGLAVRPHAGRVIHTSTRNPVHTWACRLANDNAIML